MEYTVRADISRPGDFEGPVLKPTPLSNHIPLGGVVRLKRLMIRPTIAPFEKRPQRGLGAEAVICLDTTGWLWHPSLCEHVSRGRAVRF
jgi:hypothetical protein